MAFSRIVVPYDGSRYSEKAISHAVELAKAFGGSEVILLHVIQEIPVPPLYLGTLRSRRTGETTTAQAYFKEVYQEMKRDMLNALERKKGEYEKSGVRMAIRVVVGSPADKIVEYAKDESVELIVIGRAGAKGISKLFKSLGSVSRAVSERAPCPVIIVQ